MDRASVEGTARNLLLACNPAPSVVLELVRAAPTDKENRGRTGTHAGRLSNVQIRPHCFLPRRLPMGRFPVGFGQCSTPAP